jgi:hypothetical protein
MNLPLRFFFRFGMGLCAKIILFSFFKMTFKIHSFTKSRSVKEFNFKSIDDIFKIATFLFYLVFPGNYTKNLRVISHYFWYKFPGFTKE